MTLSSLVHILRSPPLFGASTIGSAHDLKLSLVNTQYNILMDLSNNILTLNWGHLVRFLVWKTQTGWNLINVMGYNRHRW